MKKIKQHLIGSATYSTFAGCKTAIILKLALYKYYCALRMRLTVQNPKIPRIKISKSS